jgi:hypothetical protein
LLQEEHGGRHEYAQLGTVVRARMQANFGPSVDGIEIGIIILFRGKKVAKVAGQYVGQIMLLIQPLDTSTSCDMLLPLRFCSQSSRCFRPMYQLSTSCSWSGRFYTQVPGWYKH